MKLERTVVVDSLEQMCDLMCGGIEYDEEEQIEHSFCLRCGRPLKSMETRLRGYGNICYKKMRKNDASYRLF